MKIKAVDAVMVRIYLSERDKNFKPLLEHLHDQDHVRGVTVFRGIAGFGDSGVLHASGLMDLSLDLPLVVEFCDEASRVEQTLDYLNRVIKPGHVVTWSARMCIGVED